MADRAGDFGSFEELAMPLFAKLYNFAHWLTQERAAAEDLVQETYMKALRGFSSFQQGHELPRLDLPDSAKYIPDNADGTEGRRVSSPSTATMTRLPNRRLPKLQNRFCSRA